MSGTKDTEASSIAPANRIPKIAYHAECEPQIKRSAREHAESGDLGSGRMKDILQHVGCWNVQQEAGVDHVH